MLNLNNHACETCGGKAQAAIIVVDPQSTVIEYERELLHVKSSVSDPAMPRPTENGKLERGVVRPFCRICLGRVLDLATMASRVRSQEDAIHDRDAKIEKLEEQIETLNEIHAEELAAARERSVELLWKT